MGVVDQAVEDGVGDGGIADDLVPTIDRELAGDDDRAGLIAVFDDLQQIAALLGVEPREPFADGADAHTKPLGGSRSTQPFGDQRNQPRSTMRRQSGILVDVHSVPSEVVEAW